MPEAEDYFKHVASVEPGKRHLGRLQNNKTLNNIAKKRSGYELDWVSGKASFMKSYRTKNFPRSFASPSDQVFIQVSIRLIPGQTEKDARIPGLKSLEVYYRYSKLIAKIDKSKIKDDLKEEERTEKEEFDSGKDIVETTDWMGSTLNSSQTAKLFYDLLESIGMDKVQSVMKRINKE
jgi:hypothetical protein